MNPNFKDIGKTIKTCRNRRGLSQGRLAKKANISVSYLSLIELGKRAPSLDVLSDIANALRMPLNILVFLAIDKSELEKLDKEIAEKMSFLAWKLLGGDE